MRRARLSNINACLVTDTGRPPEKPQKTQRHGGRVALSGHLNAQLQLPTSGGLESSAIDTLWWSQ